MGAAWGVASVGAMESIAGFIDRLPKVELHVHLVGSASVSTVLELARRHPDGAGVPQSAAELAAFYEFRDFPHFADVYAAVSGLVREPAAMPKAVNVYGVTVSSAYLTFCPARSRAAPSTSSVTSAGSRTRRLTAA